MPSTFCRNGESTSTPVTCASCLIIMELLVQRLPTASLSVEYGQQSGYCSISEPHNAQMRCCIASPEGNMIEPWREKRQRDPCILWKTTDALTGERRVSGGQARRVAVEGKPSRRRSSSRRVWNSRSREAPSPLQRWLDSTESIITDTALDARQKPVR